MSEWKVRRGDKEYPIADGATLIAWAKDGRVVPSDYIFNPILERWMYASEVGELADIFRANVDGAKAKRLNSLALLMGLGSIPAWFVSPPLSSLLFAAAIIMTIVYYIIRPAQRRGTSATAWAALAVIGFVAAGAGLTVLSMSLIERLHALFAAPSATQITTSTTSDASRTAGNPDPVSTSANVKPEAQEERATGPDSSAVAFNARIDLAKANDEVLADLSKPRDLFHEPDCPSVTANMSVVKRDVIAALHYTPAPDCHPPAPPTVHVNGAPVTRLMASSAPTVGELTESAAPVATMAVTQPSPLSPEQQIAQVWCDPTSGLYYRSDCMRPISAHLTKKRAEAIQDGYHPSPECYAKPPREYQ